MLKIYIASELHFKQILRAWCNQKEVQLKYFTLVMKSCGPNSPIVSCGRYTGLCLWPTSTGFAQQPETDLPLIWPRTSISPNLRLYFLFLLAGQFSIYTHRADMEKAAITAIIIMFFSCFVLQATMFIFDDQNNCAICFTFSISVNIPRDMFGRLNWAMGHNRG